MGIPDNRYSDNKLADPPTGPTAGTIIQLPVIEVGQSYTIKLAVGQSGGTAWAIKLPTIPGVLLSVFYGNSYAANYITQLVFNPTLFNQVQTGLEFYFAQTTNSSGIYDTMYLYDNFEDVAPLVITRLPDLTVPGFGTVAFFQQTSVPIQGYGSEPIGDPFVYPFLQLLP